MCWRARWGSEGVADSAAFLSQMSDSEYWATLQGIDLAKAAFDRVRRYYTDLPLTIMFRRWSKAYRTYYGLAGEEDPFDISRAMQTGERGQLVSVKFNHCGSIGRRAVALVSQTVPDWDIVPEQADSASQEQADFGRKLLDYEMDIGGTGEYLFEAAEGAIIFGECTYSLGWDPLAGPKLSQPDPKLPMRTKVGDLTRKVLTPLDLVVDRFRYDRNHEWKIERTWENKWNLAARYPNLADRITSFDPASSKDRFPGVITNSIEADRQRKNELMTELIPLYTLLHKPTDALPDGKIALFLSEDVLLYEGPFPYGDDIPHATIAPGKMIRTPYGDSGLHHIMGIQDVLDNVASSIASNNVALATHVIMIPKGAEFDYRELAEGLAALEVDYGPDGKHKPEVLSLNASNEVAQSFVEFAIKSMETNSGISSTLRGNPQPNIQSGAFAALVAQQALEYAGPFQYSFQNAVAKAGNIIIEILQQYADQPRVVEIAGEDHAYQVKSFTNVGDPANGVMGISKIHRVAVKSGNPAARTPAFAIAAADALLQRGALGDPAVAGKRYLQLIKTGDLDTAISASEASSLLIRRENESFRKGECPPVIAVHRHRQHIEEHTAYLDGPETLENPKIGPAGLAHIQQHITALRETDPALLMLIGETPLPPVPGMSPLPTGTPPSPTHGTPGEQPGPAPAPPTVGGPGKQPEQPQMPKNPLQNGQRWTPADGAIHQ
jgi:hypothetical protein